MIFYFPVTGLQQFFTLNPLWKPALPGVFCFKSNYEKTSRTSFYRIFQIAGFEQQTIYCLFIVSWHWICLCGLLVLCCKWHSETTAVSGSPKQIIIIPYTLFNLQFFLLQWITKILGWHKTVCMNIFVVTSWIVVDKVRLYILPSNLK